MKDYRKRVSEAGWTEAPLLQEMRQRRADNCDEEPVFRWWEVPPPPADAAKVNSILLDVRWQELWLVCDFTPRYKLIHSNGIVYRRTWKERLFTLPWRPRVQTLWEYTDIYWDIPAEELREHFLVVGSAHVEPK